METVVVGLLSGVIGVAVSGVLQLRAQRLDQLRQRQISAADTFASAAAEVFVALTARMQSLGDPTGREAEWLEGFKAASDEARSNMHQTTRALPRIELLYGVESLSATAAVQIVQGLFRMTEELRNEPPNLEAVVETYESSADAFGRFNKEANRVVMWPQWRQWLGWRAE